MPMVKVLDKFSCKTKRHADVLACLAFFGFECYFFVRKNDLSQEDI